MGRERLPVLVAGVRGERLRVPALERGAALDAVDRLRDRGRRRGHGQLGEGVPRSRLEPVVLAGRMRGKGLLEARMPVAAAAQVGVRGAHHVAQRIGPVRGDHLDPLGVGAVAHELLQGPVEGIRGQPLGLELLQHPEVRVDPGAERVRAQHARAEPMDRGDPRALRRARLLPAPQLEEAAPHAGPHLRGRLLGEGDREYRLDAHLVLGHRPHEALHEHRGLAGAGARAHEQRAVAALHGALLLRSQLRHRSLLQIEGYLQPPFQSQRSGSEQISPLRMRASVSRMRSSAQSSLARKASGSRRSLSK